MIFLKCQGEQYKELARDISMKSKKFKDDEFEKKWEKDIPSVQKEGGVKIGTFIYWIQQDNKSDAEEMKKILADIFGSNNGKNDMMIGDMTFMKLLTKWNGKTLNEKDTIYELVKDLKGCIARLAGGDSDYYVKTAQDQFSEYASSSVAKKCEGFKVYLEVGDKKETVKKAWPFKNVIESLSGAFLYSGLTFYPRVGNPKNKNGDLFLNTFIGFKAKKIKYDMKVLEPLLKFKKEVLATGNENDYQYQLKGDAFLVQKPWILPDVCIVWTGKEGSGKNTWTDFFGNMVVGSKYYLATKLKNITGNFDGSLENKIYVVIQEANSITDDQANDLKDDITAKTLTLNPKYGKKKENVDNFCHFFSHTNEVTIFDRGVSGGRRYAIFKVSDKYVGKFAFFKDFHKYLYDEELDVASHYYSYLLDIDITGFDPQDFPVTDHMKMLESESAHPLIDYLTGPEFLIDFPDRKAQATKLEARSNDWLIKNRFPKLKYHELSKIHERYLKDDFDKNDTGKKCTFYIRKY
jgi:hypothetical protein